MEKTYYNLSEAKRSFSRIGLALAVLFISDILVQWLLSRLLYEIPTFAQFIRDNTWADWILQMVPLYVFAVPLTLLVLKKMPANPPKNMPLKFGHFLEFIPISLFIMYSGNLVGMGLSYALTGGMATNPVAEYLQDNTVLKAISVVVLAPVIEEFIFRKVLIDHSLPYGEKWAILLSAVSFGLLHQNFFQFFYAAGLGLLMGYIYVRTGCLWYTILLHGIINFMGGVIAPFIAQFATVVADPLSMGIGELLLSFLVSAYGIALIVFYFVGLGRMIVRCKQLLWIPGERELPKGSGFKIVFLNPAMVIYTILCVGMMVIMLITP